MIRSASSAATMAQARELEKPQAPGVNRVEEKARGGRFTEAMRDAIAAVPRVFNKRQAVDKTLSPKEPIPDAGKAEYTFTVEEDFRAGDVRLDLDIDHANRTDLKVTLTAPSGVFAVIHNREGFPQPNLKGSFGLNSVFDREKVKGEWKLTIEDGGEGDTGTFNSWRLQLQEGDPRPLPAAQTPSDDSTTKAGLVRLDATPTGARYQLYDKSRGQGIETRDLMDSFNDGGTKAVTDDNNVWGEATDDSRQEAAIDAHYGTTLAYDYLKEMFGRESLDGQGGKLVNLVHVGPYTPWTTWDTGTLVFYQGDHGESFTDLDVIGPELAKGMLTSTGKFKDGTESEAIADAMSQIIGGLGLEWYGAQKNDALKGKENLYVVGEQLDGEGPAGGPRDMADPLTRMGKHVNHYSQYEPERPWRAAGVATNAFYLLTHGGRNMTSGISVLNPISIEHGLKIFGKAIFDHMPEGADFAQTREATIAAAAQLYGEDSPDVRRVKEAWSAVGVKAPT